MASHGGARLGTAAVQRRTLAVLVTSQILGGIGVGAGLAVIALLAYDLAGTASLSGVPATASTLGSAMAAVVIARIAMSRGRRPGLVTGYLVGALGAALATLAAVLGVFAVHIVASLAFGWATASNLQARYAATDLAPDERRATALAAVVWATTVGAVLGPNLTGPGAVVAEVLGLPPLGGAYVLSFAAFLAAAIVQAVGLRPDPLELARGLAAQPAAAAADRGTFRTAWATIRSVPLAFAAVIAIASAHATMVAVMIMTPVHMEAHGAGLELVGLTISLHIAGMFALSPVVGWLADRLGRRRVLLAGFAQLALAAGTAAVVPAHGSALFQTALVVLGTGWSCCLVAGSALLTEVIGEDERPGVQGLSDLAMNLSGGAGGTLAGVVLALANYETLAVCAIGLVLWPAWRVARTAEPSRSRRSTPSSPDEPLDVEAMPGA